MSTCTPIEAVIAAIQSATGEEVVRRGENEVSCRCPSHSGKGAASLSISGGLDTPVLLHCFAGCSAENVLDSVGLKLSDLYPATGSSAGKSGAVPKSPRKASKPKRTYDSQESVIAALSRGFGRDPSAVWPYHRSDGEVSGLALRWNGVDGGKEFRQASLTAEGWTCSAPPEPRPLYRLLTLNDSQQVFVCEGEKCVDHLSGLGLVATTSSQGASSPAKTSWGTLGGRDVVIVPDNDVAGKNYAAKVAELLEKLDSPPVTIRIVDLCQLWADLPDGGDVADWSEHHDSKPVADLRMQLEQLAQQTEPIFEAADAPATICRDRWVPFSTHWLPQAMRGLVESGAEVLEVDPVFIVFPALAVAASAIGNSRVLQVGDGWFARSILWSALAAESGDGKSPAVELALQAMYERKQREHADYVKQVEEFESLSEFSKAEFAAWKKGGCTGDRPEEPREPIYRTSLVEDVTVASLTTILQHQSRGILSTHDELRGWFASHGRFASSGAGGSDEAFWLKAYDGRSHSENRRTNAAGAIYIPRTAVSLTGGIQPPVLKRCLTADHLESGMAARFLIAMPPRRPRRFEGRTFRSGVREQWESAVAGLFDLAMDRDDTGSLTPKTIQMSPEAAEILKQYRLETEAERIAATGFLTRVLAKSGEVAARLALIFHNLKLVAGEISADAESEVSATTMSAAVLVARWCKHEMIRVNSVLTETPAESDRRELVDQIRLRWEGRVSVRELCRMSRSRFGTAAEAKQFLDELHQEGYGDWEESRSASGKGRPKQMFVLSDASIVEHGQSSEVSSGRAAATIPAGQLAGVFTE